MLIDAGAADDSLTAKEADVGLSIGIKHIHIIQGKWCDDNFAQLINCNCTYIFIREYQTLGEYKFNCGCNGCKSCSLYYDQTSSGDINFFLITVCSH